MNYHRIQQSQFDNMNNKQKNLREEMAAIADRTMRVVIESEAILKITNEIQARYSKLGISIEEQEEIFKEVCKEVNPELYALVNFSHG